jgi:NAD(P)-dependent dehydrogenase (short-subunit alcohol dehydrogenase family)
LLRRNAPGAAALLVGGALGATAPIGTSMLLYFGPQLLRTTSFLVALVLMSLSLGVWVAGGHAWAAMRRRWLLLLLTYVLAGIYATLWSTQPTLRSTALGAALAALFLLAQPAYTTGALLASITHTGAGVAAAFAGSALGAAVSAAVLIPRLDVDVIFFFMAIVLLIARLWYEAALFTRGEHPLMPMTGKTVLVTGVGHAGQVGFALASAFARAGARVVAVDVSPRVEDLARELGGEHIGLHTDLTVRSNVDTLMLAVQERCGALHAVINAAGGLSVIKPLAETSDEEWRREIQRNGDTAFMVSTAALPLLRRSRGCIVNFAAPAGLRAQQQLGAYSAAKATVVAITRTLALEEKQHGVRANAIAPGLIDTEQNRQNVEQPDQVAWVSRQQITDVVLYLCSDAASAITGETIHVLGNGIT